MTSRSNDLQSDSDLDSIRNSCDVFLLCLSDRTALLNQGWFIGNVVFTKKYSKAGFLDRFELVCLFEIQAAVESCWAVFSTASDVQTVQEDLVFLGGFPHLWVLIAFSSWNMPSLDFWSVFFPDICLCWAELLDVEFLYVCPLLCHLVSTLW